MIVLDKGGRVDKTHLVSNGLELLRTVLDYAGVSGAKGDPRVRYGRLWRQGIPYMTLMENNINHPNDDGHRLFADALMALFPKPE